MSYIFSTLIFVMISGFIFNQTVPFLEYKLRNKAGYFLILSTLVSGIIIYTISYSLITFYTFLNIKTLDFVKYTFDYFVKIMISLFPKEDESSANINHQAYVLSILLSVLLFLLKRVSYKFQIFRRFHNKTIEKEFLKATGAKGNLIEKCFNSGQPIILTLNNRKVYVGIIMGLPYVSHREDWNFMLLPQHSGYRDEGNLTVNLENDYAKLWLSFIEDKENDPKLLEKLDKAGIIIHWDDIDTVSAWIPEIYDGLSADD